MSGRKQELNLYFADNHYIIKCRILPLLEHPKCVNTVKSLERTQWVESNPDSATIDKKEGVEHWSDALRYAVEYLYPIRAGTAVIKRGFGF